MAAKRNKPVTGKKKATIDGGLAAIVLAAGKGTRMRSARTKVLHAVLGRPLVAYPVALARQMGANPIIPVLGHQLAAVEAELGARFGAGSFHVVEQAEQRGTGHAVRLALPALGDFAGIVYIVYGDVPLLQRQTLEALVAKAREGQCLALVTARPPDPTGYGRVVRDKRGNIVGVVEHKDASPRELRIADINAGIYAAPAAFLREATAKLDARNAQGELYLTDIVAQAARSIGVFGIEADPGDVSGINDRQQLAEAEAIMRARVNRAWMTHVTFRDPASTVVEPDVQLGEDVELGRNVSLRGRTRVGAGTRIDDGTILIDTEVGAGVQIKPYCIATESVVGDKAIIGPFAHLRSGTNLGPEVHVGNFVETKKTTIGRGSKANHLSYLGDATIGEKVNVGAGTITCNYNGYEKFPTVIEDQAFIGSDSQLVAPVRVGKRAVIAAGTTVTGDVPAGALSISRVAQVDKAGYADKVANRYADRPKK
ncbi:MAG TPA: bifunctional UDP-N-acetylglucosamine diphosphorylase/glucosamine-1-phosphate N-acetyltransferase GlmU [Polyangia bacterium]|jgi:bifunctional UDP-N-acetylglucosamine pyrophosphorylase/glucosamine-1-phosphate N-acetyltransferase|nr:bifunctional UDP-N-acetylglucosamine diphosphorylase/glucosamine-1-phosphate N-acetyltransferase GlmU [Polyangia bacterium]